MQQQIASLERALLEAMRQLDALKRQVGYQGGPARVTTVSPAPTLPYDQFVAVLEQALVEGWGDLRDFTDQTFQRLFELSGGDGLTVATFLRQLATRQPSRPIDSLAGYTVGVIRKVGVEQLRAEQVQRGLVPAAPAPPPAPGSEPTWEERTAGADERQDPPPQAPTKAEVPLAQTAAEAGDQVVDALWDEMWGGRGE